ncbi:ribosome-recycling factor, mitochondrial-like [Corticium candelabrum]|uniref:ribosome-recycling factor, mitochondrial-like n=1 Tax=Corticium candelabrum TaxID=121492 RepID=UPI002E274D1E|nr:ribosome-recycling factor, mitochondrial-like [Corticium candelabrum]
MRRLYMYVTPTRLNEAIVKRMGSRVSRGSVDQIMVQSVIDVDKLESKMESVISGLKWDFTKKLSSRITPGILDDIAVQVDGKTLPLNQLGHIAARSSQIMLVNLTAAPQAVGPAVRAIRSANLGLTPLQEGCVIKIPIPKMTKELREQLSKAAKQRAEKARVGIRKVRQKGMNEVKQNGKTVSQNDVRMAQQHIDSKTALYVDKIDRLLDAKRKELLQS